VRSLNKAFLSLLVTGSERTALQKQMRPEHWLRLTNLSCQQRDRLATVPFLLFSLRERDDDYWEQLLLTGQERDLFTSEMQPASDYGRLVAAGLGFIWQLARRNPYSARLICGASLHWCEMLAEQTFFRLLALSGTRNDLVVPRSAGDTELWSKLLHAGVVRENSVRQSAQLSALQAVLTRPMKMPGANWAVAACKRSEPHLRVADETDEQ
jgi:hypothetical protein